MTRSLKKGPYIVKKLLKKVQKLKGNKEKPIKTWARNCVITPEMIGFTFLVHNGKEFVPVEVTPDKLGHRLGEFAISNKRVRHGMPGIGASKSSMYVPLK